MIDLSTQRLLDLSRRLLPAKTFGDLLDVVGEEVRATVGYPHAWFAVAEHEDADELKLINYAGGRSEIIWSVAPVMKVKGDRFLEELVAGDKPVVIEDARVDPRTDKKLVEQLQNRTLINIPLILFDKPLGFFGVGTFGDEGCRAPTPAELDYLVGMAAQIAIAAARLRFLEANAAAERQRLDLERRMLQLQKLESLGMLAGGIAHDFNNLLTVILSCASLAGESTIDAGVKDELTTITEAAVRGRDLTRKLLAMGRQLALDMKPLDMNARMAELVTLLRRVLPETIRVDVIKGVKLPLIEGDPSQIDQVFMNLCINARDAMPEGGSLTIETEQVLINERYAETHPWAKPGRYLLTTVTDTGTGMPRDVLDRIFDPFFTTKGPEVGTGLGLAVAYGIVRQHGGMLLCYSELNVGTSFKVYLPALERMADAVGTKLVGTAPKGHGNERVLIAEDDPAVRAVATRILQRAGYRVTAVENGDAAVETAAREAVDLVVTDVVMPGLPCRQLVQRLRALHPEIRILLSSGYTAGLNVVELLRETGLELVRKPYDPDQLLFAVRKALGA